MKIIEVPINKLKPDPANVRTHDRTNIDAIKKSLSQFNQQKPIVVGKGNIVVAGNATLEAAKSLGWTKIAIVRTTLAGKQAMAYAIADNKTALLATWDDEALADQLKELQKLSLTDFESTGFDQSSLDGLLASIQEDQDTIEDEAPEPPKKAKSKLGDLYLLGNHRLLCGDATKKEDVERLMDGQKAVLCHADPPYGMGKENEGIANDNLYRDKLDAFQMAWWKACRPFLADNGSAYIWGNPEDLWRLWYCGGLKDSERLTFRNEITWDKGGSGYGVGTEAQRCYVPEERCLFFMLGEQGFNDNADNYWQGWEKIRSALATDCEKMGWTAKDIKRICGVGMYAHWFTVSQWMFIPEEHYRKLQAAAKHDAFKRDYDDLKRDYDDLKRDYDDLKRDFYDTRAYFDNTHDNMTDVWRYNRVTGEERFEHATPKPVTMISRCIKSSIPPRDIVLDPFGGSGSTLIACEQLNRKCYMMEIDPRYCDVIVERWEKFTGGKAKLEKATKCPKTTKT